MDERIIAFEQKYDIFCIKNDAINKGIKILDAFLEQLKKVKINLTKGVQNNLQLLSLDSLQFQITYLENEVKELKRNHTYILNRTYGDYYKFYKYLLEYYAQSFPHEKKIQGDMLLNSFPVYLDLEPSVIYPLDKLKNLHVNLTEIFKIFQQIIKRKEEELSNYRIKKSNGLNIHNFVTMYDFGTNIVKQELNMYMEHVEYIDDQHIKYLSYSNKRLNTLIMNTHNDIDIKKLKEEDILNEHNNDVIPEPNEENDENLQMKVDEILNDPAGV